MTNDLEFQNCNEIFNVSLAMSASFLFNSVVMQTFNACKMVFYVAVSMGNVLL